MTDAWKEARRAQQAERYESAIAAAVTQLMTLLAALDVAAAESALDDARPISSRILEDLAAHLAAHPDALTSGDSHCPPVLLRMVHVLHAAGYEVVRPGCASCGGVRVDLPKIRAEGRICSPCDNRTRRGTCARCGRTDTHIAAKRPEGVICSSCYRTDPQVVEECRDCGRLRSPARRLPDGSALCGKCWERPEQPCAACSTAPTTAGEVCYECFSGFRRVRRPCGRCGRMRIIARNATGTCPDLCHSCYRGPQATCTRCGRERPCKGIAAGTPVCESCSARERPPATCSRCRRDRLITAHWPMGPVCDSCYVTILRTPAECPRCGDSHPLIARDGDGAEICGPCVGFTIDYVCRACGRSGHPFGKNRCAYCVLGDKLRVMLTGPDGHVPERLEPLIDAFCQVRVPAEAIRWTTRSPNAALLARLVADGRELSHDLLDELTPGRNEAYVRQVLVQTGVLPKRDEDLERLPSWLEHLLAGKPQAHARLVRPYLHWYLLRRARNRRARQRYPTAAGHELRRRVHVALEFLSWVDERKIPLRALRQRDIDQWLADGTTTRYLIRYFLAWTAQRRLTTQFTVPTIPLQQPVEFLDEDDRWSLLKRCLTDEEIPLDVRAAGALTLLFGLSNERLRYLTANQLRQRGQHFYLTVGNHPVVLPPRLGNLLQQLADQPLERPLLTSPPAQTRLLFPGMVPGRPIAARPFSRKLARYGINVRPARNAALAALATDLPAPILADILGMHTTTAVRWVTYVRRDWTAYLAARTDIQREQPATGD
ncbi:hypothetical protein [Streptomyces orinoci]|uniref:Uncharacterized protein n=1 Tax=Streptomyces orinoci TaxID=67339 RepID=A0ABV3JUJ1_STRON|nr:hypothetical protein [Streptomyces orinoci]